jgi:hypothetical protein
MRVRHVPFMRSVVHTTAVSELLFATTGDLTTARQPRCNKLRGRFPRRTLASQLDGQIVTPTWCARRRQRGDFGCGLVNRRENRESLLGGDGISTSLTHDNRKSLPTRDPTGTDWQRLECGSPGSLTWYKSVALMLFLNRPVPLHSDNATSQWESHAHLTLFAKAILVPD